MNFLGGYGSGSDSDENAVDGGNAHGVTPSAATILANKHQAKVEAMKFQPAPQPIIKETADPKKKKKIEILNMLPANIQAALQGDSIYDSDDGDDSEFGSDQRMEIESETKVIKSKSGTNSFVTAASKPKKRSRSSHDVELLSLLPKVLDRPTPVSHVAPSSSSFETESNLNDDNATAPVQQSSCIEINKANANQKIKGSSVFSMPLVSNNPNDEYRLPTAPAKPIVAQKQKKKSRQNGDNCDEEDGEESWRKTVMRSSSSNNNSGSLFNLNEKKSQAFGAQNSNTVPIQMSVQAQQPTHQSQPSVAIEVNTQDPDLYAYQQYQYQQQMLQYQQQQQQLQQQQTFTMEDEGDSSSRRRDRRMEAQLLHGNMEAVNNMETSGTFVARPAAWDRFSYEERQAQEAEVSRTYKIGQNIQQSNRLQNRKHQINSLAVAAANTELEMLDAKGRRNKSKAETAAKYGW